METNKNHNEITMELGEMVRELIADYEPTDYVSGLANWFSLIDAEKHGTDVQLTDCKMLAYLNEFFAKVQKTIR